MGPSVGTLGPVSRFATIALCTAGPATLPPRVTAVPRRCVMAHMESRLLAPAPETIATPSGDPRFGTYQGEVPRIDLGELRGRWKLTPALLVKRKRWVYAFIATREVACMFAILDLGYTANSFAMAVDLTSGQTLFDRSFLGPPKLSGRVGDKPDRGLSAWYRTPRKRLAIWRDETDRSYRLTANLGPLLRLGGRHIRLAARLRSAGAAPALTVIAPADRDGLFDVTEKRNGLPVEGTLQIGCRTYALDGGFGGYDYSQGVLPRHTFWRWAFLAGRLGDGTPIGLNLVEGFNEGNPDASEDALWLGDQLVPLDRARFSYDRANTSLPWRVTTLDGSVDLEFRPVALHREKRDLVVVSSRFEQHVGSYTGTVRVDGRTLDVVSLPGVTEMQDAWW